MLSYSGAVGDGNNHGAVLMLRKPEHSWGARHTEPSEGAQRNAESQ